MLACTQTNTYSKLEKNKEIYSRKNTVDGLIFVRYQFSWFWGRVKATNSSTHKTFTDFLYEGNILATNFESHERVILVQSTKTQIVFQKYCNRVKVILAMYKIMCYKENCSTSNHRIELSISKLNFYTLLTLGMLLYIHICTNSHLIVQ